MEVWVDERAEENDQQEEGGVELLIRGRAAGFQRQEEGGVELVIRGRAAGCRFVLLPVCYILHSSNYLLTDKTLTPCISTDISAAKALSVENTTTTTIDVPKQQSQAQNDDDDDQEEEEETDLKHIVFCIAASSRLWEQRKEYIKRWWRPGETRGVVWLDKRARTWRNEELPQIKISSDTSGFPYKHAHGSRSALRLSRIVSETEAEDGRREVVRNGRRRHGVHRGKRGEGAEEIRSQAVPLRWRLVREPPAEYTLLVRDGVRRRWFCHQLSVGGGAGED